MHETMNESQALPPDVVDAINAGQKIEAIKLLREATGIGLKEAKHSVDLYAAANPQLAGNPHIQTESGIGRIVLIAVVVSGAYVAYRFFG